MIPRSLMMVITLLAVGFSVCLIRTRRIKAKENKYQRLGTGSGGSDGMIQASGSGSYQNATVSNYAMPPQQKVNTYCVIDSRLVDTQFKG
jgi:hypothetical protein